jgi:hypothetical protein
MKFWKRLRQWGLVCFALLFALIYWAAEPSNCGAHCNNGAAPTRMPTIH